MDAPIFGSKEFRRALGLFATGVTIITACAPDGAPLGRTCNSFGSLSLGPPLVQWSIARSSRSHRAILAASHFAVHVLAADQGELCSQFAAKGGDRFAGVPTEAGVGGVPLLTVFHARFECAMHAQHEAGDHTIIVGRVLQLCEHDNEPLVFHKGLYKRLPPNARTA